MGKTKTSKHRGARTFGRGKKAGRGKGKRGGRGRAGGHKHKWILTLKTDRNYFGSKGKGFKRPQSVVAHPVTVNVGELTRLVERLAREGAVPKDAAALDLTTLGFDKLLGSGKADRKWELTVESATARAVEKVEGGGGKVHLRGK
jgi:large subunit ribosomal protein L15